MQQQEQNLKSSLSNSADEVDNARSDITSEAPGKGVSFKKLSYSYSGKHSEGNRFITDIDL